MALAEGRAGGFAAASAAGAGGLASGAGGTEPGALAPCGVIPNSEPVLGPVGRVCAPATVEAGAPGSVEVEPVADGPAVFKPVADDGVAVGFAIAEAVGVPVFPVCPAIAGVGTPGRGPEIPVDAPVATDGDIGEAAPPGVESTLVEARADDAIEGEGIGAGAWGVADCGAAASVVDLAGTALFAPGRAIGDPASGVSAAADLETLFN